MKCSCPNEVFSLAADIMELAAERLMVSMPFLRRALFKMPMVPNRDVTLSMDGDTLYYDPKAVIISFRENGMAPLRAFLHMIMHCIFLHPFRYEYMDRECWDLACDLAVEAAILDLGLPYAGLETDERLAEIISGLTEEVGTLYAERLYRYLSDRPEEVERLKALAGLFVKDSHELWITDEEDADDDMRGWMNLSNQIEFAVDMSKEKGLGIGVFSKNVKAAVREKADYGEFLKKFAVMGEEVHINDDEFDYIYYTYGLGLYEDMPLVEPLEYRDENRIRDFVIAIDTSGSCKDGLVEKFLRKTYNILKNADTYFEHVNIHIIQCDSIIQHDEKITNDLEFETYMQDVELEGFGGTDFRPVFKYVDRLIKNKEFKDLKGLIYFTDGEGQFPEVPPDYKTAFVFIDNGKEPPAVPSWAIRLVLESEDEI